MEVYAMPSEQTHSTGENALAFDLIEFHFKQLTGRILTVVDAAFNDPQQRKAVKDLMRAQLQTQLRNIAGYCNTSRTEADLAEASAP